MASKATYAALSLAAVYALAHKALARLSALQEGVLRQRSQRENVKKRFRQSLDDSAFTLQALLPSIAHSLQQSLDVEALTAALAAKAKQTPDESDTRTKAQLWHDIKIHSFTRTLTAIYLFALVSLHVNVQMAVLARYAYVASVASSPLPFSALNQQKYLTLTWFLLNKGARTVQDHVQQAVEHIISSLSLKADLSLARLYDIINAIRDRVESDNCLSAAMLPNNKQALVHTLREGGFPEQLLPIDKELIDLMEETKDLFESADFALVRTRALDRLFKILVDKLEPAFADKGQSPIRDLDAPGLQVFTDLDDRVCTLAKLLPPLARQLDDILLALPNTYLDALSDVDEVTEFDALIYTTR